MSDRPASMTRKVEEYEAQIGRLEEQLQAVERERDYFRDRLPDFSKVQQDEFARAERLQEQLQAATSEDFSLVPKDEYARLKGIEEQLEAAEKFKAAMVRANQRQVRVVNAAVAYCSDLNNRGEAETHDLEAAIAALYPASSLHTPIDFEPTEYMDPDTGILADSNQESSQS